MKAKSLLGCFILFFGVMPPCFAFHSSLMKPDGTNAFSEAFLNDYNRADQQVTKTKSVDPMIDLLSVYKNPEELAELYLSIGVIFNQRTGLVDPQKAVLSFTAALQYRFSDDIYVEILLWRAGSYEQLKNYPAAIKDCLRGLLICSYYDLSAAWPQVDNLQRPAKDQGKSDEMAQVDRANDERAYRQKTQLVRKLLMWRYYFIEIIQRLQKSSSINSDQIRVWLKTLSSDEDRIRRAMNLIAGPNPMPKDIRW